MKEYTLSYIRAILPSCLSPTVLRWSALARRRKIQNLFLLLVSRTEGRDLWFSFMNIQITVFFMVNRIQRFKVQVSKKHSYHDLNAYYVVKIRHILQIHATWEEWIGVRRRLVKFWILQIASFLSVPIHMIRHFRYCCASREKEQWKENVGLKTKNFHRNSVDISNLSF